MFNGFGGWWGRKGANIWIFAYEFHRNEPCLVLCEWVWSPHLYDALHSASHDNSNNIQQCISTHTHTKTNLLIRQFDFVREFVLLLFSFGVAFFEVDALCVCGEWFFHDWTCSKAPLMVMTMSHFTFIGLFYDTFFLHSYVFHSYVVHRSIGLLYLHWTQTKNQIHSIFHDEEIEMAACECYFISFEHTRMHDIKVNKNPLECHTHTRD